MKNNNTSQIYFVIDQVCLVQ